MIQSNLDGIKRGQKYVHKFVWPKPNDFRTRSAACKQTDTLETVPDYLCDSGNKPATEEECNADPCRVRAPFTPFPWVTVLSMFFNFSARVENWRVVWVRRRRQLERLLPGRRRAQRLLRAGRCGAKARPCETNHGPWPYQSCYFMNH